MLLVIVFLFSFTLKASEIKVMTFNTMCDFCGSKKYDEFSKRKNQIAKIISKHSADLISLQEIRTGSQAEEIFKDKPQYKIYYSDSFLISYADPTLAINTTKFEVLEDGQFWLGPNNGKFSLGWKFALPRQVVWTKLKMKENGFEFYFIGSHFDNRVENMLGSAKQVNDFVKASKLPVIFAADTNSTSDFEGYKKLVGSEFKDSYNLFNEKRVIASTEHKNLCYHRKGDIFPDCRVDHILLSNHINWKTLSWQVDTQTFGKEKRFPSDHRPVISTIQIIND